MLSACLKAGCDLELTSFGKNNRYALLGPLLQSGNITKEDVEQSATRLFFTRMSLGEFDPPEMVPWRNIPLESEDFRNCSVQIQLPILAY